MWPEARVSTKYNALGYVNPWMRPFVSTDLLLAKWFLINFKIKLSIRGTLALLYIFLLLMEYRTKFDITRCENTDFLTLRVRKTAFTHSD